MCCKDGDTAEVPTDNAGMGGPERMTRWSEEPPVRKLAGGQ